MKAITIFAMFAVLANVGAARSVNQSEEASAPAAKPSQTNGQQRGIIFDFRKNKNAFQELQRIDNEFGAGLLERTLRNADIKGGRSRLARELERDDDLVRTIRNHKLKAVVECQVHNRPLPWCSNVQQFKNGLLPVPSLTCSWLPLTSSGSLLGTIAASAEVLIAMGHVYSCLVLLQWLSYADTYPAH